MELIYPVTLYCLRKCFLSLCILLFAGSTFAQLSITSVAPTSGPVGTTVTITGSNFGINATDNIVYFGPVRAYVQAASPTSLTVIVPLGASYSPVTVTTGALTAYSVKPFVVTFSSGGQDFDASSFEARKNYETGYSPSMGCYGDFDNDGKPDFAIIETSYPISRFRIARNISSPGIVTFSNDFVDTADARPGCIVSADLDGDGRLDLILANWDANSMSVIRNTSAGPGKISFAKKVNYSVGRLGKLITGDFNNDNKPDIAAVIEGSLKVFKNTSTIGSLSFSAPITYSTGRQPVYVASGDVNGDNKLELFVTNTLDNTVSVYNNSSSNGNISFDAKLDMSTGLEPRGLTVKDLDGDGKADLLVASYRSNALSVFKNTTIGTALSFEGKVDYPTASEPWTIDAGDIDGDGKPDLVVLTREGAAISVFRNISLIGDIKLAVKVDYAIDSYLNDVTVQDIDKDGKPDLTMANDRSPGYFSVLLNKMPGLGTAVPPIVTAVSPSSMGPNSKVIITGNNFTTATNVSFGGTPANAFYVIAPNIIEAEVGLGSSGNTSVTNPSGTGNLPGFVFKTPPPPTITSFSPATVSTYSNITINGTDFYGVSAVSFGGISALSFKVLSTTSISATVGKGSSGEVAVTTAYGLTKSPGLTFISPLSVTSFAPHSGPVGTTVTIEGTNFSAVATDNIVYLGGVKVPVITASSTVLTITVPAGIGSGTLTVTKNGLTVDAGLPFRVTYQGGDTAFAGRPFSNRIDFDNGGQAWGMNAYDLNQDGKLDIITAKANANTIRIFRNSSSIGKVNMIPEVDLPTGANPQHIAVGDLNGDGKPDIVVANPDANSISVFRNTGSKGAIAFAPKVDYVTGARPWNVSIGDLDKDGKPEIVVPNIYGQSVSIFRNTSSTDTISFETKMDIITGSQPVDVAISDLEGDGLPELVIVAEKIYILHNISSANNITFATKIEYSTSAFPNSITVADINDDGKGDIIIGHATNAGTSLTIFKNQSTTSAISLTPAIEYTMGSYAFHVTTGDLNGDGKPDLSYSTLDDKGVGILKNISSQGGIYWTAKFVLPSLNSASETRIGDIDGDGQNDLMVSMREGFIGIFLNKLNSPFLDSFSPASAAKDSTVTLKGEGLSTITAVNFGGVPAASFSIVDAFTIKVKVGNGASGVVQVKAGEKIAELNGFTFIPPPVITSFSPDTSAIAKVVTISGENFVNVRTVSFGGTPAASYNVLSATQITAVVAAGTSGDIVVITAGGSDTSSGFVFIPAPIITSFTPATATIGDTLTIKGINLKYITRILIADNDASYFSVTDSSTIKAVVDFVYRNDNNIVITGRGGTSSKSGFTFVNPPPPTITSFTPAAPYLGKIVIKGSHLLGTIAVAVGGGSVISFKIVDDNTVEAVLGWEQSGTIGLTTISGKVSVSGFVFIAPPVITGINPASGTIGSTVTITGSGFNTVAGNNIVYFGGVKAIVKQASPTALTVTVPVSTGYHPVSVTTNIYTAYSQQYFTATYPGIGVAFTATSFQALPDDNDIAREPYDIHTTDIDGDGKNDLIAAVDASLVISRNIGTNAIEFASKIILGTGDTEELYSVTSGDLDGDGKPELIVTKPSSGMLGLFKNLSTPGNISFAPMVSLAVGAAVYSAAVGDMDGDGKPDLVVADNGAVRVFQNVTSDKLYFAPPVTYVSGNNRTPVYLDDIDKDGRLDMVIAYKVSAANGSSKVLVLRNRSSGYGGFVQSSFTRVEYPTGDEVQGLTMGDMNNDGYNDIVTCSYYSTVSVFRNTSQAGSVSFAARIDSAVGFAPNWVNVSDLDGDGKVDILVSNFSDVNICLLKNKSSGNAIQFNTAVYYALSGQGITIGADDLDGDSKPDIIISNYSSEAITIFKNTIADPQVAPSGTNPITGNIINHQTVDATVQTFDGSAYVQRHYDVTPENNPDIATGTITLYFTQEEFDNFNAHPAHGLDLPHNPTDYVNKSNLRVYQYHGVSAIGLPGSYTGSDVEIDPADSKIVWNPVTRWWEISFDVNGFSGFFLSSAGSRLVTGTPQVPVVSNMANTYCSNLGTQKVKINNLPLSTGSTISSIKLDGNSLTAGTDSTFSFNPSELPIGTHTITIVYANTKGTRTTSISFEVITAVSPDVNLNANTTSVTTTAPVVITAVNNGGGTNGLYTFAINRSFTDILQPEGAANTLTIDPAILVTGDNWIYVQLKVSGPCLIAPIAIDSIKLNKIAAPQQPVITGINASYCNSLAAQQGKVTNLPVAGNGIAVSVKLDNTVLTVIADGSFSFNVNTLTAGKHTIQVIFSNAAGMKTATQEFSVTAVVTPKVNASANVTIVTSLIMPVTITATSIDGGTTPVYTFAKDRGFTNILQTEGINPQFTFSPSVLSIGDNWIYVRMKTSATCYITPTAIDSILLKRDAATGIIDPDNPGRTIGIAPNPFQNNILVNGLNSGKKYQLVLYNNRGQIVYSGQVNNKVSINIPATGIVSGIYWLSIYDAKKKLLGTEKVVKY